MKNVCQHTATKPHNRTSRTDTSKRFTWFARKRDTNISRSLIDKLYFHLRRMSIQLASSEWCYSSVQSELLDDQQREREKGRERENMGICWMIQKVTKRWRRHMDDSFDTSFDWSKPMQLWFRAFSCCFSFSCFTFKSQFQLVICTLANPVSYSMELFNYSAFRFERMAFTFEDESFAAKHTILWSAWITLLFTIFPFHSLLRESTSCLRSG